MYPIPPGEHLVENRTCRHCQASFPITDKDLEFYDKVSPVFPKPPGEGDLSKAKKCKAWMSEGQGGSVSFPLDKGFESALLAASYGEAGKGDLVFGKSEQNPPGSPLDRGVRKYLIPPPTLCPDCRQQRRLSFRNERKLYKRKCDATGKDIISIYSPDKPYKVYHQDYWWSDKWDPMDYGREFDFSKGFFEQFGEMMREVPISSLYVQNSENSEYTNYAANNKNCYLTSSFVGECEDCSYGNFLVDCQDSIDCSHVQHSQNCYQCIDVVSCSHVLYSDNTFYSSNSYYLSHCTNCSYCFGCVNLTNKTFHIYNKPYAEQEYFIKLQELLTIPSSKRFHDFLVFKSSLPQKYINTSESEIVIGDYIFQGKDIMNGFDIYDGENIRYSVSGSDAKDCQDCTWFGYDGTSQVYESANFTGSRSIFSCISWFVTDVIYCTNCFNSKNLFGCVGLHNNQQYCILNRQYTKEEYESLVPKIIEHMSSPRPSPKGEGDGISSLSLKETSEERSACTTILKLEQSRGLGGEVEWGEFFPASLSPFGYNETVAQEYFPMTREEVIGTQEDISSSSPKIGEVGRGVQDTQENNTPPLTPPNLGGEGTETFLHGSTFNWSDYEPPFPKVAKIIPAEKLPDDISKIPDDILNWAIECEVTKKPFRIIKQELDFYRKHHLPIPRRHPDQRHLDRMKLRNPRKLYERLCDCAQCETNNKTSTLSSSEGESLPLGKGFSQSENDKGGVHTSREQIPHFELNPKTGTRTKKIITTYSPDRKEIVYCEECYNREVIG